MAPVTAHLMGMTDAVWRRHANPWSGWTRLASAPFVFLALWSPHWIGWWALGPAALLAVWTWANPRVFPEPRDTGSWMTQGVFGERVWLNRHAVPIPAHHATAAGVTTGLGVLGLLIAAYGFATADFWAAFMGWNFSVLAKLWFVDRMVWLYWDMKSTHPAYTAWEMPPPAVDAANRP